MSVTLTTIHTEGINPCVVCGKELTSEITRWIELDINGTVNGLDESMGQFPVGPECEKGVTAQAVTLPYFLYI